MTAQPSTHPSLAHEALRWAFGIGLLGLVAWAPHSPALYYALCFDAPIGFEDADRNADGFVSLREAGYACNVDTRPVRHDGRTCIEFYSRVDWSPIKTVCGDTPLGASGHAQADLAEVRTGFLVAERIREL